MINISSIENFLLQLQKEILNVLLIEDGSGKQFSKTTWTNTNKGYGYSYLLKNSTVFEQAGVNFSHVYGNSIPISATFARSDIINRSYEAIGLSIIIHPYNPYVPTTHANVRFFLTKEEPNDINSLWWFGGGFDLTPFYGFEEDAIFWHQSAYEICKPFGKDVYLKYKKWCDDYFYIKHRNEQRGIGGLFFDDLNTPNFEYCFNFMKAIGNGFMKSYQPIVARRKNHSWSDRQRQFQLYRRGRYVEFNLIYDRGTKFGLQTDGRVESILMSMPPLVRWESNYQPEEGSLEEQLYKKFLPICDWLSKK